MSKLNPWEVFNTQRNRDEESQSEPLRLYRVPPPTTRSPKDLWWKYWNYNNDPFKVNCKIAFDSYTYCKSRTSIRNAKYILGRPRDCTRESADLTLCMKVKTVAEKNPAKAQKILELSAEPPQNLEPEYHVWEFRREVTPNGVVYHPSEHFVNVAKLMKVRKKYSVKHKEPTSPSNPKEPNANESAPKQVQTM